MSCYKDCWWPSVVAVRAGFPCRRIHFGRARGAGHQRDARAGKEGGQHAQKQQQHHRDGRHWKQVCAGMKSPTQSCLFKTHLSSSVLFSGRRITSPCQTAVSAFLSACFSMCVTHSAAASCWCSVTDDSEEWTGDEEELPSPLPQSEDPLASV